MLLLLTITAFTRRHLRLVMLMFSMLNVISYMSRDFYEGWLAVTSYRRWLMFITGVVVVYIYIFTKDAFLVAIFNLLTLNTIVFFCTRNIMMFYVAFEVSLIPIVLIILSRGYQPERVTAVL